MSEVLLERPRDHVALIRFNRPEQRNALSLSVRKTLAEMITALTADPEVRAIVITGDDRAFAAGADLRELAHRTVMDTMDVSSLVAWRALEACGKPLIAAIRGYALGGGLELAMHCDILIAGEGAKIGQPEVKVGIMPGAGGVQRFMRATGKAKAMRWLLTGDMITAREGLDAGLLSEVVADADVLEHSLDLASRIAALPPLAVAAIKENVLLGADAPLPVALQFERKAFQLLFATEDKTEGVSAFLERRTPEFKGR